MTIFDDVKTRAQEQVPSLQIKFKNESILMKMLGKLLFFNPAFMNEFTTTIGSTVYFPNQEVANRDPIKSATVLLHELVHIFDSKKENKILFSFLYLVPQIFVLLFFPLFFILGWKIALLPLLFLAPLPAYFRMKDERKAYTISMYVMNKLGYDIDNGVSFYSKQFKSSSYYFMWPFSSIDKYFKDTANLIKLGNRPYYEEELYDLIDKVLQK